MLSIGAFARLGQVPPRMLRHYDRLGLHRPEQVDPDNGYSSYDVAQLIRLRRLLALRDLGFTLDQIRPLLDDELPIEELRGMLRLRRAQIEETLAGEENRIFRVEAHLRALERSNAMLVQDVVIKQTRPLRVAEAIGTAGGFGHERIGPVFRELGPLVLAHLEQAGARPGHCVGYYDEPEEDGSVTVHVAFEIGDQAVEGNERVQVVELPVTEVASLLHRGGMNEIEASYESLFRWIDDSGYQAAGHSRELYLEMARRRRRRERH